MGAGGRRPPDTTTNFTLGPAATDTAKSNAAATDFDFDRRMLAQVDWSIWRAVFNGHFRLAVRCDTCGRWLAASASKRAGCGPRCAEKAVR